jgi:rubredoxin
MGQSCPQCGSENVDFGMPDIGLPRDGTTIQPDWACLECGFGWSESEEWPDWFRQLHEQP